jgi:hypothetical protein
MFKILIRNYVIKALNHLYKCNEIYIFTLINIIVISTFIYKTKDVVSVSLILGFILLFLCSWPIIFTILDGILELVDKVIKSIKNDYRIAKQHIKIKKEWK